MLAAPHSKSAGRCARALLAALVLASVAAAGDSQQAVPAAAAQPAPAAPRPGPLPPAANLLLAHDLLREIVAVRSVHDLGTGEVAEAIARRLRANGFGADEVQVLADEKYPHQVNVVARFRGHGRGKPVMWICHTDVVEARAEDWSVPPFALTEKDGWFYGRGTADMKDQIATVVASLVRLRQEGYVPERDIIAAFTADEEIGWEQDGLNWLLHAHPQLVDAGLVINPDDHAGRLVGGQRRSFEVGTSEKTYATYRLEATAAGGHSSLPGPENAIYRLARALRRLQQYAFPLHTNATTRLYFQRMAAFYSGQRRADMLAVARPTPDPAAAARLSQNTYFNAILRTTCVATMLSAGEQENSLPERAAATVQCRVMPGESFARTRAALSAAVADPQIRVTLTTPEISGPESPPTDAFLGSVERVVHSMWPEAVVLPSMAPGASDSLYTRNAGMPTYIVAGTWEDFDDDPRHGRDERRDIRVFDESVEFTYRLMKELAAAP